MVNEQNLINLINNKKSIEEVREIDNKYEIPSFEEFMKSYERNDNLNYDDLKGGSVGEVRGYGSVLDPEMRAWGQKERERERREKDEWNWCIEEHCSFQRVNGSSFCKYHKEENDRSDRWTKWGIRTATGMGVSWALGSVGSVIAGGAGWLGGKAGEAVSDSKDAKEFWSSVSSFGGDIAKGELAGELWGIGGSEIAKELGASATKGFKVGEKSYSVYSTGEEAIVHQKHLDQGKGYKSDCKVCNLLS